MPRPLVSVICLCFNHERFVRSAVTSVLRQTYEHIQIIVWDDASADSSPEIIRALKDEHPQLEVTLSPTNEGNCTAFNSAYALAKGEFVIDFSTDDVMDELRVEKQIAFFESLSHDTGVIFTDATYIDEQSKVLRHHYEYLFRHRLITKVESGNVFRDVLTTYYIASPTMMMRRIVLDTLGGYDEDLAYEDFDLWVRSSRIFKYAFLNDRLTFIRQSKNALSTGWYVPGDKQLHSTYLVCRKAVSLCRDDEDRSAVIHRVSYELKHAVWSGNHHEGTLFWQLLLELDGVHFTDRLWHVLNVMRLPLRPLRRLYHLLRYGRK